MHVPGYVSILVFVVLIAVGGGCDDGEVMHVSVHLVMQYLNTLSLSWCSELPTVATFYGVPDMTLGTRHLFSGEPNFRWVGNQTYVELVPLSSCLTCPEGDSCLVYYRTDALIRCATNLPVLVVHFLVTGQNSSGQKPSA